MNDRAQEIFEQIVDLAENERSRTLDDLCGDDAALRSEIEALLSAHGEAGQFMDQPTVDHVDAYSAPTEEAGTKIGRYKLLEKIGQGGFGDVFMAQQLEPIKRRVALKVIKLGMDTKQVVARFEAERQALALMDHANIASVLDGGQTASGRPYFVMELVRGDPITEYCDRERVPMRDRLKLFQQVCAAIQHAHQKGVIHRDIKPNNVLVTVADGKPLVKVIDFGIAKATNTELTEKTLFTEFRQLIGTPQYMSPEQAERSGVDIDTRSDVYSLGVLLYEMLTGRTPVDITAMKTAVWDELQRMIREDDPPKPSTLVTSKGADSQLVAKKRDTDAVKLSKLLKGDLDWIVLRALEKDRTRRYGTASELADDVQRYLDDEAVTATPPSATYKLTKLLRRHRTEVAVAATLVATLLVGIVATSVMAIRAARAHRIAEAATEDVEKQRKRALRMAAMVATNRFEDGAQRELTDAWLGDLAEAESSGELTKQEIIEQKCQLAVWWFSHGGGNDAAKMIEEIYDEARREIGIGNPVFTGLVNANIVSHIDDYDVNKKAELFGDLVESMRLSAPPNHVSLLPQYAAALVAANRHDEAASTIDKYLEIRNGTQPNPQAAGLEAMRLAAAIAELEPLAEEHADKLERLRQLQQTLGQTGRNIFSVSTSGERIGSRQIWEGVLEIGAAKLSLRFNILRDKDGEFSGQLISVDQGNATVPLTRMSFEDGQVHMEFESAKAKFVGKSNDDNTVCEGTWIQGDLEQPLTLRRVGG